MSQFKYKAINKNKQAINGIIEAPTEDTAINILKDKGMMIVSLEKKKAFDLSINLSLDRIKMKDVVVFSRQFSVLISANVALVQALKILSEQTNNNKMKLVLGEITSEIDGGMRLSEAFGKRPDIFSDFYVNVVKSGETSGKLDEVLNYLSDELEKDYDMMAKIRGAMIYPAFVFSGLVVVGIVMMVYVVPKLLDTITQAGGELPLPTKILIATSGFLQQYYILLIVLLVATVIGCRYSLEKPAIRAFLDRIFLSVPIFGKLFQKIYLVRFTRSMSTLIMGGVNISKGLKIAADVSTNAVYKELIEKTRKEVEDGNSLSTVFSESNVVPTMVSQMMSIGEKTGRLDLILNKISDFYTREINNTIANLMSLMEPIIMIIMAIAVGIMVAAIILPMYNMASQF